MSIRSIDKSSVHRITSGQVLIDLQTAVKELVENSLDAGATNIEVKFQDYGLKSFEAIDNGSGISPDDYEHVGLKHYTSKLSTFEDLSTVQTFGFRGEALSSLCALSEQVTITTATANDAPMGTVLELDRTGKLTSCSKKAARQRGTTILAEGLFKPLPVRRREFERNSKREFAKALNLLTAYALVPCAKENKGVRLSVVHQQGGRKSIQLRTEGQASLKASISSLWGPKQLESLTELNLSLQVLPEKTALRRSGVTDHAAPTKIQVRGLISKFAHGFGRTSSDRQFFFINGRPCNPSKIQKAFNEVYRTFNATQSPFIVADFTLPTDACDINVSPDKRTILLHSENALIASLREALEEAFSPTRSTFLVQTQSTLSKEPLTSLTSNVSDSAAVGPVSQGAVEVGVCLTVDEERSTEKDTSTGPVEAFPDSGRPANSELTSEGLCDAATDSHTPSQTRVDSDQTLPADSSTYPSLICTTAIPLKRNPSPAPKSSNRAIQMILSTANASWSMQPADDEPPRKKYKLDPNSATSRSAFRSQLLSFAAAGSQPVRAIECLEEEEEKRKDVNEADGEQEEDELEQEELDELAMGSEAATEDVIPEVQANVCDPLVDDGRPNEKETPLFLPESEVIDSTSTTQAESSEGLTEEQKANLQALENSGIDSVVTDSSSPPSVLEVRRKNSSRKDVTIGCDLAQISSKWGPIRSRSESVGSMPHSTDTHSKIGSSAGISNVSDEQDAEHELSRVIDKSDFGQMDIIGQFNRGFIIARRQKPSGLDDLDDLFIIDQHAADEKYNFETLQETTKIDSQKLFKPRPLELTAADELLALDNIDVLRSNGFELAVDEDVEPSQGRIRLVAQPVSGNTTFDLKDLEELLHLMQDRPAGQKMVRCSKVRAMFAMRACRKSVMIGKALTQSQMTSVVRHMGTMDQPWNCPHGRPTMRHLVDLRDTSSALKGEISSDANVRPVNWKDL